MVLGAGFGGLELCTLLSEALGDSIEVTLIDKNDHFVFGFSKLDVMFGHAKPQDVRLAYANFAKPGVQLIQQTITKIDPVAKRVTTNEEATRPTIWLWLWAQIMIGMQRRVLPK